MANLKLGELQRRILQYGYDQWILRRAHYASIQGVEPARCTLDGAYFASDANADHITMPEATALSWQLKGYQTPYQTGADDAFDIWYLLGFSAGSWSQLCAETDILDDEKIGASVRRNAAADALQKVGLLPGLRTNAGELNGYDWWRWNWLTTIPKADPCMNAARTGASKALKGLEARGLLTIDRHQGRRKRAYAVIERITNDEHPEHIRLGEGGLRGMFRDSMVEGALKGLNGKGYGKASTSISFTGAARAEVESWSCRAMPPVGIPDWGMPLVADTRAKG